MNVSDDIVNDAHMMRDVINNNKFKKLTWTYYKKGDNEIAKCHDQSSKLISVQFSDHEGPLRMYFSSKEYIDRVRVNYFIKNNVLVDTIYSPVYYGAASWVQYQFDDEFKFEFYE